MKLLFIKLRHIGDSLLLTPTLVAARDQFDAEIWVVTRRGSDGILAGCPAISRVLTTASAEKEKRAWNSPAHDMRLLQELRSQNFDYAFELADSARGRWMLALSGAQRQLALFNSRPLGRFWNWKFDAIRDFSSFVGHAVAKDFQVVQSALPLQEPVPPLCFSREAVEATPFDSHLRNFAVIHPGTRWQRKRWPLEKWVQTGKHLLTQLERVVITAGSDPAEAELARALQQQLGGRAINAAGLLNWRQMAGLLYRARLIVGVDTAAIHLAAACQCPSVVVWGPTFEIQWKPWRAPHRLVLPPGYSELKPDSANLSQFPERKTADVEVADVCMAVDWLLAQKGASTPRA